MQQLFFILISIVLSTTVFAGDLTACKGKYALCTTAKCEPVPGKSDLVSCHCDVKTGYSAGQTACKPVQHNKQGELIYSRYFPIKRYAVCKNDRPWAWCLDKPCYVNKNNPNHATCMCSIAKNQGPYIIVTKHKTSKTCTTGIISSATLDQSAQITQFLETQPNLKPFKITVIK